MLDHSDKADPHDRNPAGRLFRILKRAKLRPKGSVGLSAWAPVLCIPDPLNHSKLPVLLKRMALVLQMPDHIEAQINTINQTITSEEHKLDREQYIDSWRNSFAAAAPFMNSAQNITDFNSKITEACIASLGFVSRELNRSTYEPELDPDVLAGLRKQISEIIDELQADTTIESKLSLYILQHLFFILETINEYEFAGIVPIHKAINATVGAMIMTPESEAIAVKPIGKKIVEFLKTAASFITLAKEGPLLIEKGVEIFTKLLPP